MNTADLPPPPASPPSPRRLAWWKRGLACIGGGAFMSLAFPPVDWAGIVWVGLMPLLTVLWMERGGFWRSFRAGWLYGMGLFCTSFYWICEVGNTFGIPLVQFLAVALLPLMGLYALLPALWAGIAGTLLCPTKAAVPDCAEKPQAERKRIWGSWAAADTLSTLRCAIGCGALWACIDWMRGYGTLSFGWNTLGMALYDGLSFAQWAEYTGAASLAFIPVFTSVILWCALRRTYLHFKGVGVGCRPWDFYAAVIVLFALFAGGVWMSQNYSPAALFRKESVLKLPAMAVQLNQDQAERFASGRGEAVQYGMYLRETMSAFHDIQRKAIERAHHHPELGIIQQLPVWVVWPETAAGLPFWQEEATGTRIEDPANTATLFGEEGLPMLHKLVSQMGGQPFVLFTGMDDVLLRREENLIRPVGVYNSMAMFPNAGFEGMRTAAKQHLMPFGEFVPLAQDIEFVGRCYTAITGIQVGEGIRPGTGDAPIALPVPGTDETVGVIPAVCYEDTVGILLTKFARKGAQVIVNITNNGWFNNSPCGDVHARAAAFRCIELRRPMLRAANKGVCCAIAPNGAPIDELRKADGSPHIAGYSYALLPVDKDAKLTFYARFGDWAVALCALLALVCASAGLRKRQ